MLSACGIDVVTRVYCGMWSNGAKEECAIFETELEEELLRLTDQSPVDMEQTRATRKRSHVRESCSSQQLLKLVREAIASLKERKQTLESVEEIEARTRATMILLP